MIISIHSTTRVETRLNIVFPDGTKISIHSTTRVETKTVRNILNQIKISIHSTTRVETGTGRKNQRRDAISIHSTTRVETFIIVKAVSYINDFNPLHHEGGDLVLYSAPYPASQLQSTPPRGWRPRASGYHPSAPRISIHSTTRVETVFPFQSAQPVYISIHSTTRVETPHKPYILPHQRFQSTPPRGWRPPQSNKSWTT